VIASIALSGLGLFANINYGLPVSLAAFSLSSAFFIGECLYRTIRCLKGRGPAQAPPVPEPHFYLLPQKPLKDRLPQIGNKALNFESPVYSSNPSQQMAIELDDAVRQGMRNQKKNQNPLQEINFKADIQIYLDKYTVLEWVGTASCASATDRIDVCSITRQLEIKGKPGYLIGFVNWLENYSSAVDIGVNLIKSVANKLEELEAINHENLAGLANCFTKIAVELGLITQGRGRPSVTFSLIYEGSSYQFHVGNSRILLIRNDTYYQLTEDQDFTQSEDFVTVKPKMSRVRKSMIDNLEFMMPGYQTGDYLILATEGFWENVSNTEAFKALHEMHQKNLSLSEMAGYLVDAAISAGCEKSVSVIVYRY
jgi:serine/threonine protein phosphatase PrpC